MADMTRSMLEFARTLRETYGIPVGHSHVREALCSLETAGIRSRERARYALRLVFASKPEHLELFDRAFERFFTNAYCGMPQPDRARTQSHDSAAADDSGFTRDREPEAETAHASTTLRAHYSEVASGNRATASVPRDERIAMSATAARLLATLRLGRSRRFTPAPRGSRFDLRRTLRASLQTGAEPVRLRMLAHPRLNPRVTLIVDASRSMSEFAPRLLAFARALCRRSLRARAFVFSTGLREITKELRGIRDDARMELTGESWGGGTRIGFALETLERRFQSSVDGDTLVIIASDGLDFGDAAQVKEFMRRIHRRAAEILWLNPHAGSPDFQPEAKGMQAALPYVGALLDAGDLDAVVAAARNVRR